MYKGFSLIELLFVLLIVGILTSITYPSYRQYITRVHRNEGQTALLDLANRMESYYSEHKTYESATIGAGNTSDVLSKHQSDNGWYLLSIILATHFSYELIATPTKNQAKADVNCQSLTFNSSGVKGLAKGPIGAPSGTVHQCWQ